MSTSTTVLCEESRTFRVSGLVRFASGLAAAGIHVVAFDQDLRTEQLLGESPTDQDGAHRIEYHAARLLDAERGTADLVVKAPDSDGSILIASAALFNAAQDAEIDLTVPPDRLPPETDTVSTVGDTTLFPTAGGAL